MACIYLLNSSGGPQSFDFVITTYSYPLIGAANQVSQTSGAGYSGDVQAGIRLRPVNNLYLTRKKGSPRYAECSKYPAKKNFF